MTNTTDDAPRMIVPIRGLGNSTPDDTVKMMLLNDPEVAPLLGTGRLGVAFTSDRRGNRVCILEAEMADLMAATCAIHTAMPAGSFTHLV